MDNDCKSLYSSIGLAVVLFVSEILPFIKSVRGQGIIDALYKALKNDNGYTPIEEETEDN